MRTAKPRCARRTPVRQSHELLNRLRIAPRQKRREHRAIGNANAEWQLAHERRA